MPPKKGADSQVYNLPHERQVELLSEALLREYMHKRKFTDTLRVFDEENPRGPDTISSRALMSDLMTLKPETQKAMKADGIETIMEMLCCLRVQRRLEVDDLKRRAAAEVPPTPEKLKKKVKSGKRKKEKRAIAKEFEEESQSDKESCDKMEGKRTRRRSSRNRGGEGHSDNSSSDEGTSGEESASERGSNGDDRSESNSQIGKKAARALLELLCGEGGSIPASFVEQGFAFDEDVDYGLSQRKRGPDGVMSVVQAFICAFFFKGSFMDLRRHRRQCLIRSIMTVLSGVQPQARSICLVDGDVSADSAEADLANMSVRRNFASMQDAENALHDCLDRWMQPKGSGVLCFLLSALLSHGVKEVNALLTSAEDTAGTQHLISAEGYCSTALTEFLLPKESATAAGDDDFMLGNLALGMGAGGATCGFVTSKADGSVTVVNGAPLCPVWLVHHKGRHLVLFLKRDNRRQLEQRRASGAFMSVDVFFYEPSVPNRGDTFLTVSVNSDDDDDSGRNSLVSSAIRSLPLWPDCAIQWNGAEPPF